jgi:thiaminase/transcriptional activator TenA
VHRRRILPDLGVDAGEVDLLVEPSADPILASVGNKVRKAADLLVVARLQPIAPDYLHATLLATICQEPESEPRRMIVALTGAFFDRAIGNSSRYLDDRLLRWGTSIMPERFTETLRAASEPGWSHAVGHRFVKGLFAGAMPDAVMARYLIQDHRFLDSFLILLGSALVTADTFEARLRLGRFVGAVSSEENTYFLRSFEALGVTEDRRAADPDTQATAGFKAIMREAAEARSYAAALSVLVVTEWLYLDWASRAPKPLPDNFVHAEWITLHDNPNFRAFVDFLRAELDRVGLGYADLCRDFFGRAVALELSFFEAAYADRT